MEENKFDPSKQYRWEPTDQFELTGADFNLAYNTLLDYVNTPEVRRVMRMVRTFEMMHQKFVNKVDDGTIKPVDPEQEGDMPPIPST